MAKGLKNSLKKKARGGSSSKSSDGLAADPNMIRQLEMTQMKYSKLKQDLQVRRKFSTRRKKSN